MRQWLSFDCNGQKLAATLDAAAGGTGLLILSGGNETRSGAHGGMAALAARIARAGYPVFRFDRRGVGDSGGENTGYDGSAEDIAAAAAAFRAAAPGTERIVLFGNCDAATALALFHDRLRPDALILANPWVIEAQSELPPPAAIRARYRAKLLSPREWLRLLRGGVNIGKIFKGLYAISKKPRSNGLADRMAWGLAQTSIPVRIVLARRDATALAFADCWAGPAFDALRGDPRVSLVEIDTASHSFARPADADALYAAILGVLLEH